MHKKKTIILIISILVCFAVACASPFVALYITVNFPNPFPQHSDKESETFELYKDDFEFINNYIIENFDRKTQTDGNLISICFEEKRIYLYDGGEIELSNELQNAFKSIKNAFEGYEFSFVEITDKRISYGGLGYRMYVYSRDGKKPKYYYSEDDEMNPETFKLGDNWYLLCVNFI